MQRLLPWNIGFSERRKISGALVYDIYHDVLIN
jgi:hypothetical protein